MRTRTYTTARLYRWVRPKRNPMADAIEKDPEQVTEEPDEEEEEEDDDEPEANDGDTCIDSWETENGLVFELHVVDGHEEVLVVEEDEKGNQKDVALALNLEDLDEAMEVMKEIREEIVNRKAQVVRPQIRPQVVPAQARARAKVSKTR